MGSLIYVMHCIKPNITFTTYKLFIYKSIPSKDYWKIITRVLGYLKKTMNFGLFYNKFSVVHEGYMNASWITSVNDNKLTFRRIFI